jgi:hypothetical protein
MSRHTEKPVKLVYSHPIKQRKKKKKDKIDYYPHRIFQSKVIEGGVLEKTIHSYRMWFLFLKLGLELEKQNTVLVMKESVRLENGTKTNRVTHNIKVNKSKYKDWDLNSVLTSSFDLWWENHRYLFVDELSKVLTPIDRVSKNPDHLTIQFDTRRRFNDIVNDLRIMNREENLFQRKSREKYSISGRIRPITLLNRYNCLVLKLEDELTNEEILTHENNYIRPTNKKTKDGYSIQKKEKTPQRILEGQMNYGRTIFDLISGTKKSFGGKQILLSVCDGYFLKHPTNTYL